VEALTGSTFINTITSDADEYSPYWLEDGTGMAFVRAPAGGDPHIFVVDFETGAVTQLTTAGENVSPASRR